MLSIDVLHKIYKFELNCKNKGLLNRHFCRKLKFGQKMMDNDSDDTSTSLENTENFCDNPTRDILAVSFFFKHNFFIGV